MFSRKDGNGFTNTFTGSFAAIMKDFPCLATHYSDRRKIFAATSEATKTREEVSEMRHECRNYM